MVSAKKKQMSEAQLLKAKQAKLKENEKMLRQIHSFFKQTHIPYLVFFKKMQFLQQKYSGVFMVCQMIGV